ncbi:MAG TPA: VOC family protein [Polyangiales bacterium]|nr:VOC family protein [Polyangiales bacterium]
MGTTGSGLAGAPAGGSVAEDALVAGSRAGAPVGDAGEQGASGANAAADGGVTAGARAATNGGSSGAAGGIGGTAGQPTERDVPPPVESPQIWGFGIGVSDVPAAKDYFKDVMNMEVENESFKRDGWTETVLFSNQAMRGARLSLMDFDDMRNTRKITAKLIWQVKETAPIAAAASRYPGYVQRLNFGYLLFDGPDTYIQELGTSFDDDAGNIEVPYIVAMGFVISDAAAARKFYTSLGMVDESLGSYPITDSGGSGTVAEYTVRYGQGMAIVLQTWSPARNAKDNPVKVVISVPNASAMADKVVAAGGTIVSPPSRSDFYGNRVLVVAKDLDGYMLDLVE